MKQKRLRPAIFSDEPEQLQDAQQVAHELGVSFAEVVRRSLRLAMPKLRESAKHAVGIRAEDGRAP